RRASEGRQGIKKCLAMNDKTGGKGESFPAGFSFDCHSVQTSWFMYKIFVTLACIVLLRIDPATCAEPNELRVLDKKLYHLGTAGLPEWQEFEGKTPHGRRLDLTFQAQANAAACTLFIRQDNVKFPWTVRLNSKKIGELTPMDALQVSAFVVPAGTLVAGENTLAIVPPAATDDILVGDFQLDSRPRDAVLSQSRLLVKVTDKRSK